MDMKKKECYCAGHLKTCGGLCRKVRRIKHSPDSFYPMLGIQLEDHKIRAVYTCSTEHGFKDP